MLDLQDLIQIGMYYKECTKFSSYHQSCYLLGDGDPCCYQMCICVDSVYLQSMRHTHVQNGMVKSQDTCSIYITNIILSPGVRYLQSVVYRVGEVRSLLPEKVNIMALTATATVTLRKGIVQIISMKNAMSPNRCNIIYSVKFMATTASTISPLVSAILEMSIKLPQTIVTRPAKLDHLSAKIADFQCVFAVS